MRSRLVSPLALVVLLGIPCSSHADPSREDLLKSLFKGLGIDVPQKEVTSDQLPTSLYLEVTYNQAMQPLIGMTVGGEKLDLVFATGSGNTYIFAKEMQACSPNDLKKCYSLDEAQPANICRENADRECLPGQNGRYDCRDHIKGANLNDLAHSSQIIIGGVRYSMKGVEAENIVRLEMHDLETRKDLEFEVNTPLPFRFLLSKLEPLSQYEGGLKPPLFYGTGGLFSASGVTLSCRVTGSIWHAFLALLKCTSFRLEFRPPERARLAFAAETRKGQSRVLLNPPPLNGTVWSEPKQMGDYLHSGLHGFILFHPTVCGVDILQSLRNASSSNWFAVVDTAGPCLTLPSFLFDRLMVHLPVKCPFNIGEPSLGRLCAPDRTRSQKRLIGNKTLAVSLPALSFNLEDDRRTYRPASISLPLERLVYDADPEKEGGDELLCVARSDSSDSDSLDMTYAHISFGSLVLAAVNAEMEMEHLVSVRIGLSSSSNASLEATDDFCSERTVCVSPMQEHDASSNQCVDPECSRYMFMTLDHDRKVCTWNALAPVCLGIAIAALVILDLFSHRLYKQAIERAKDSCQ